MSGVKIASDFVPVHCSWPVSASTHLASSAVYPTSSKVTRTWWSASTPFCHLATRLRWTVTSSVSSSPGSARCQLQPCLRVCRPASSIYWLCVLRCSCVCICAVLVVVVVVGVAVAVVVVVGTDARGWPSEALELRLEGGRVSHS